MTTLQPTSASMPAQSMRDHRTLFLIEGVVLIILGLCALIAPLVASLAATVFIGAILLVSGIAGLITTLRARGAPGFSWSLLSAVLGIGAGALLLAAPVSGTISLTLVLIAFLFFEGILSIMYAIAHRTGDSRGWVWILASGVVDVILGALLLAGLPGTALWALGILIGVNMMFGGWSLIAMATAAAK